MHEALIVLARLEAYPTMPAKTQPYKRWHYRAGPAVTAPNVPTDQDANYRRGLLALQTLARFRTPSPAVCLWMADFHDELVTLLARQW